MTWNQFSYDTKGLLLNISNKFLRKLGKLWGVFWRNFDDIQNFWKYLDSVETLNKFWEILKQLTKEKF